MQAMSWPRFMVITRAYRLAGWRGGLMTSGPQICLVGIGAGLRRIMVAVNDNGAADRSAEKD